ncbi:hypothetical protein BASA83_001389 [Batrachochytrium salamandrivorans]|nr:hypothetical protein BASA83_001389 [Batrachochytrium salamandrivorans]
MLVSPLVALLAISATSVSAANYATYNLLKDDRDAGRLVFIPTSLAQREVILSNVDSALTAWANYDSKILNYGPASDPFPTIKNLRKNIETITDEDLQLGLTDAFTMIRDHHTRWINICDFYFNKPRSPFPLWQRIFPRSKLEINCLQFNGLSFVDWFEQNKFKSGGGANEFGGQRSALRFLSQIPQTWVLSISRISVQKILTTNNPVSLKAIMVVRSLLANELKDTNSVIYELRGNPGGSVSFSDGMVQVVQA